MKMYRKIFLSFMVVMLILTASGTGHARGRTQRIGDVTQFVAPVWALFLTMNRQDSEGTEQLLWSYAANMAVTYGLKAAIHAPRPQGSGTDSFPSGHAASGFSGASFITRRYGFRDAVIPYAFGVFTAYSRVHARRHYTRDVIASFVISEAIARLLVTEHPSRLQIGITPNGMSLRYTF